MRRFETIRPFAIATTFLLAAFVASAWAQPARRPLSLDDLAKVRTVGDPQRSPDGAWVAYTVGTVDTEKDKRDSDIWMTSWDGTTHLRLTSSPDSETMPRWSPDGQWIAYLEGDEARYGAYDQEKLAVAPAAGGASRVLTGGLDRTVAGPVAWTADGGGLLFSVVDDRAVYVGRVGASGGPVEKVTSGRREVRSLSPGRDGAFAVLATTATELPEVHALENGQLRRLSHQNDDWLGELQLATTEDITSTSKDGTEVHGLLVRPAGYTAGKRYPTILNIHGGPKGQDAYSFSFDREFLAANGYVVLAINYRGSDGRGSAFQKAIYADWGNKEVVDLIGAVDKAIAMGVADPDRLGIGGWSYGGILTDATISLDPRFKAATSGAGVALQLSFYGVDHYIVQWDQEIGPPWKNLDTYLKISAPFFRADKIKTPTLFMGGEKDFNVPLQGSEQMYQALKSLGIDTQLVIYPGQFHGITMPSYVRDRAERRLAWYDKYLKK